MFTVYVLYSEFFNKIYIGFTSDIEQRLFAHNDPRNKGWTRRFAPWTLVYTEQYDSKPNAMEREKQLKDHRGRDFVWEKVKVYHLNSGDYCVRFIRQRHSDTELTCASAPQW